MLFGWFSWLVKLVLIAFFFFFLLRLRYCNVNLGKEGWYSYDKRKKERKV